MKLLIVNSHLETGGIRQSLLNLLSNISDLDIDIDLQLLKYDPSALKDESLKTVSLCPPIRVLNAYNTPFTKQNNNMDRIIKSFFWMISKVFGKRFTMGMLMKFVPKSKKYDIAISFSNDIWAAHVGGFNGGCNDYVLKRVDANKKIGWVHNDPHRLGFTKQICTDTYKEFQLIVNVSNACKDMFDFIIPEYTQKSKVVYNMLDIDRISMLSQNGNPFDKSNFHIVTVARLDNQQKCIDRIIYCCEKLKKEGFKNFKWHIIGDGPDKDLLNTLSKERGTQDVIIFEGQKDNPFPYMKYADVFVLVSDYEAFGMVVMESLSLGTPVICTNYPASQELIVREGNGIITDISVEGIFSAVSRVLKNPEILKKMRDYISMNSINNEISLKQFKEVISGE